MEKSTREKLIEAALTVLGTVGGVEFSVRAAEDAAGVPHGSARHHFGDSSGLTEAMVDHLLANDLPDMFVDPLGLIARWLGPDIVHTRARYELTVLTTREPALAARVHAARETIARRFAIATGGTHDQARLAVAALDGLVLDCLVSGRTSVTDDELHAIAVLGGLKPDDA